MNLEKLLYHIGFFIFGSLLVLTFLQLHSHQGEALLFIFVGALLYGGLVFTFYRKKAFWFDRDDYSKSFHICKLSIYHLISKWTTLRDQFFMVSYSV